MCKSRQLHGQLSEGNTASIFEFMHLNVYCALWLQGGHLCAKLHVNDGFEKDSK